MARLELGGTMAGATLLGNIPAAFLEAGARVQAQGVVSGGTIELGACWWVAAAPRR